MADVLGAIDIGATTVLVGIANSDGYIDDERVETFATPSIPDDLLARLSESLRALVGSDNLVRIGCVAPGPVDLVQGTIVRLHNRSWPPFPISNELAASFGCEVILEDDATGAALGEALHGAGVGYDPVAYLTVSSGVGAGLVVGGRVYRGANGLAGEVGHLVIDSQGPLCNCGRRGDVESFAGGISLTRQVKELWPRESGGEVRSPAELFELAAKGDVRAVAIYNAGVNALAHCLASMATLWDPQLIVVGGSVALAHVEWIREAEQAARSHCMSEVGDQLQVSMATLGVRSALFGAGALALKA
jgi:glucokinase